MLADHEQGNDWGWKKCCLFIAGHRADRFGLQPPGSRFLLQIMYKIRWQQMKKISSDGSFIIIRLMYWIFNTIFLHNLHLSSQEADNTVNFLACVIYFNTFSAHIIYFQRFYTISVPSALYLSTCLLLRLKLVVLKSIER